MPVELVRCGFKSQFPISMLYLLLGVLVHLYFALYSESYFPNFQDCFSVKLDFNVYKVSRLIHSPSVFVACPSLSSLTLHCHGEGLGKIICRLVYNLFLFPTIFHILRKIRVLERSYSKGFVRICAGDGC